MSCCISNSVVSRRFDLLKSLGHHSVCLVSGGWPSFFIEAAVCCFYVARLRFLLKGYDSARMLGLAFVRPIGVLFSRFFFCVRCQVPMTSSCSSTPGRTFTPRNPTGQFWSSSHTLSLAGGRPCYARSHCVYKLCVGGPRTHFCFPDVFFVFFVPLVCIENSQMPTGRRPLPWTRRCHKVERGYRDAHIYQYTKARMVICGKALAVIFLR